MTLKTDLIQTGDSGTTSQLFTQRAPNDGTFRISRGAAGATTEDNLVIGATGKLTGTVVQSTLTDATAGALMAVGAFGLGLDATALSDANAIAATGFYSWNSVVPGAPAPGQFGTLLHINYTASDATQFATSQTANASWFRTKIASTWGAWQQVMTSATSLGVGQTWQNVTGSRALGVTYTNNTGRPIQVNARCAVSTSADMYIEVGGVRLTGQTQNNAGLGANAPCAVVPNGATYIVNVSAGTGSVVTWTELR